MSPNFWSPTIRHSIPRDRRAAGHDLSGVLAPCVTDAVASPSGMSGRALEYDFRDGGRYKIELRYEDGTSTGSGKTTDRTDITKGRFLQLVPGRRIKQSVEFESSDPTLAGEMTMTWSFEPASEGAMVTVTADNVPRVSAKQTMMPG